MDINLIGGAYEYRSKNINAQVCENFFMFVDQEGGIPVSMINTPGSKLWKYLGQQAEVRGARVFNNYLYVICGNTLYRVSSTKVITTIGTIGTSSGPVSMSDNGTQMIIVDGSTTGYIFESGALSEITDDEFPGADVVQFNDGYFLINQPGTDYWWVSGLYDGNSWDALTVGTAEYLPDATVSILVDHDEVLNFGKKTVEPFRNIGDPDFPYEKIDGALMEMGCAAAFSPAKIDNSVFWLNDRDQIVRLEGYTPKIISTRQIEYQISKYSKVDDAIGFTFYLEGISFYCLTFPTANETWLANAFTGMISKWLSYPLIGESSSRHRANCYVKFGRTHLVGDYENGNLYELDMETYEDNDEIIKRVRTTAPIRGKEGKQIVYPRFELEFEGGAELSTGQGSDPFIILEWSDDSGKTWSSQEWNSLGKIGDYTNRAIWTGLGRSFERIFRITVTDPVRVVITRALAPDAYLED